PARILPPDCVGHASWRAAVRARRCGLHTRNGRATRTHGPEPDWLQGWARRREALPALARARGRSTGRRAAGVAGRRWRRPCRRVLCRGRRRLHVLTGVLLAGGFCRVV